MEKWINPNAELVITQGNVKRIGEIFAIKAVQLIKRYSGARLDRLYRGLVNDIQEAHLDGHIYSDGYDVAQTAICFLCGFIGKKLGDKHSVNKQGEVITIKLACYKEVNRYIDKERKTLYNTFSIENLTRKQEPATANEATDDAEAELTAAEEIIERMDLTEGQKETLNCYMAGMTFVEVSRFLSVNISTVWRRKKQIQQKYIQLASVIRS